MAPGRVSRMRLALLFLLLAGACVRAPIAPPAAPPPRIVVAPPVNDTGDQLVVSGRWDVAMLLGRPVVTVPDVLGRDLARILEERGFGVATSGAGDAAVLRVTLRRFMPDTPRGEFVVVDLDATLEAPGGPPLWTAHRDRWIVPTRGAPTLADALGLAAGDVARALVGAWAPPAVSSPDAR